MTQPPPAALAGELREAGAGRVTLGAPLARFTTYRLGGPAAVLVEAATVGELVAVATVLGRHTIEPLVVGRGSNLLVPDAGLDRVVVHLDGEFDELRMAEGRVLAGAAVALPVLARRTAAAGWAGLEFYVGIPGSVGGAVCMNAGGHGRDTAEVLVRAWTLGLFTGELTGEVPVRRAEVERDGASLRFGYLSAALAPGEVVLRAEFRVERDDPAACDARLEEIVRWRREHQPGGTNAGSVFRNPEGESAGRIIDACGLKGLRIGGAVVSPKHANFFQAQANATAADVRALILEVRRRVQEALGVTLEPEIRMVGFENADGAIDGHAGA